MRASQVEFQGEATGTLADFFGRGVWRIPEEARKLVVTRTRLGGSREPDIFSKGQDTGRPEKPFYGRPTRTGPRFSRPAGGRETGDSRVFLAHLR